MNIYLKNNQGNVLLLVLVVISLISGFVLTMGNTLMVSLTHNTDQKLERILRDETENRLVSFLYQLSTNNTGGSSVQHKSLDGSVKEILYNVAYTGGDYNSGFQNFTFNSYAGTVNGRYQNLVSGTNADATVTSRVCATLTGKEKCKEISVKVVDIPTDLLSTGNLTVKKETRLIKDYTP